MTLGVGDNDSSSIALFPSGNVGIGTLTSANIQLNVVTNSDNYGFGHSRGAVGL